MKPVPSYTVDRDTAATLREWLFEKAVEKHGESEISEPLAELAAAIDGELYEQAEAVELGAWARTVPPTDRDASLDDRAPDDKHRPNDARAPAEPAGLDTDVSEPDRIYDTLPDSAWQLDHDQSTTNREDSPTATPQNKETAASIPHTRRQNHRPSVRYRTSYECSVCGGVREIKTSLRVCAFVDECATCGTVARFAAAGIPTPLRES
jgi:hypothetical protein